jgi:hypothetical protein
MAKRLTRRAAVTGLAAASGLFGSSAMAQRAGKYPRIRKAIAEMKDAREFMREAPNVFGGHKKRAIDALDAAIKELQEALDFAK